MARVTTNDEYYAQIAAAIRGKNGESAQYAPAQMAAKIAEISTGAALEYAVAGSSTRPEAPAENTIWVQTAADISGTVFQFEQPASPQDGLVWISMGAASHVPFRPVAGEGITLYPLKAKQYSAASGAWSEKTAESYIGGAWKDWNIHLYEPGNEYTHLTGGWNGEARAHSSSARGITPTVTRGEQELYVTAQTQAVASGCGYVLRTAKSIDLTDVASIHALVSGVSGIVSFGAMAEGAAYQTLAKSVQLVNGAYSVDVSALSGQHRLCFAAKSTTSSVTTLAFRVQKVWLE